MFIANKFGLPSHGHTQAPENPKDGDRFVCDCGCAFEFVILNDGKPGEWVGI
jgi:hypothetical protein